MADKLYFRISSALKNIIGQELITDDFIAVFELVKNTFDAHATEVRVIFEKDKLIIRDNGKGMTIDDIKNKWLHVAHSAKNELTEDDEETLEKLPKDYRDKIHNRSFYAGAKGIGRFSCDKLGKELVLLTKKAGSSLEKITVKWTDFEEDFNKQFIDIPISHEKLNGSKFHYENGTELIISKLSSNWSREKKLELKHSLEKLINPFSEINSKTNEDKNKDKLESSQLHSKKLQNFNIYIESEEDKPKDNTEKEARNKVNGVVKNKVFEKISKKTTTIETTFSEDGKFIYTELTDRGDLIYKIKEENTQNLLSDIKFTLFYLNRSAKDTFKKYMGINSVDFGSVFLFKNGFRVYPFGDEQEDLLGIDRRHQQGFRRYLGTRNIIGSIEIYGNNKDFKETSSRDGGLIKTESYEQMVQAFFDFCLKRLERYVVEVQWIIEEDKFKGDTSLLNNLKSKEAFVKIVSTLVDTKHLELIKVNSSLLDIVEEKTESAQPTFLKDLSKIVKATTKNKELNAKLSNIFDETGKKFKTLVKQRENAEAKAAKEKAEKEAAEKKAKEAQVQKEQAEKKAKDAEYAKKEAEQKAKDEQQKRKDAELKAREEKIKAQTEAENRKKAEEKANELEKQNKQKEGQILFLKSINTQELDNVISLHHQIGISSNTIDNYLYALNKKLQKGTAVTPNELSQLLEKVGFENKKILSISRFATKANFNLQSQEIKADLISFIQQYIENVYTDFLSNDIKINFLNKDNLSYIMTFKPIEITIILDNIINNSKKNGAKELTILISSNSPKNITINFSNNGKVLDKSIKNVNDIFEKGFTTTTGSGLGLYHVSQIVKEIHGKIEVIESKEGFNLGVTIENAN